VLDVADCDGDGWPDVILGNFSVDGLFRPAKLPPTRDWFTIWHGAMPATSR
jgi:hypothetical protein